LGPTEIGELERQDSDVIQRRGVDQLLGAKRAGREQPRRREENKVSDIDGGKRPRAAVREWPSSSRD
jgi:hypothetical protein